jgi:hypothetical protein
MATIPTKVTHDGTQGTVVVDGHDITSSTIAAVWRAREAGQPAELTLTLYYAELHHDGPTLVTVDQPTHDALVAMGWTPPDAPQG